MKALMKLVAILLVALLTIGLMGGCQAGTTGTEPNKISTLEEEKGKTLTILIPGHNEKDETLIHGIYIGRKRELFERSVGKSQEMNMTKLTKPIKKAVVYLDPREFRSTWLGNKAVYRTRMAMEEGGELIVLAPNVKKFGEDDENDRLIRKYGYVGRKKVLELVKTEDELKNNLSVAAHLIHGSSDGKFKVTYCTKHLTKEEIESVGFDYMPYDEAVKKYNPEILKDGYNTVDGEEIYYISNPALGLWTI